MAGPRDQWPSVPHDHVMQFYDDDEELIGGVAPYLADAIHRGGTAIVIATAAHRRAFSSRLAAMGIDVATAGEDGTLVMLDAAEAVDRLLVDGRIAPLRFDDHVATPVRQAASRGGIVRAYGEIVALLWAAGQVAATLELEGLWNDLGREVEFSLHCAYPLTSLETEDGADSLRAVCDQHSAVLARPGVLSQVHPAPSQLTRTFECTERGPADARRFVTETLVAWGRTDLADDAAVVATELATNAVVHARTGFTITVSRPPDGIILLAVRDDSDAPPVPRQAGPYDGSGRGLRLVEAIAGGWTADILGHGKVVWIELGRPS